MPSMKATTLSLESIDRFRNSLSARGRTDKTVKAYSTDLRTFLREIDQPEITMEEYEDTAMNWLQANRKKLAPKTTGRRLTSLREFVRWAGWPVMLREYSPPTPAKAQPHPLPEGMPGVRRLLDAARHENHKALVALCGFFGCRVAEALSVGPKDFDLHNMMLEIRGKGDKTRFVPISKEAWSILAMPVTRAMIEGRTEIVGLKDRFARRVIKDLGVRAGLARPISSHDLRATFCTAVYSNTGNDIRVAQELMGHSSVETTQLYTEVTLNKMREAVDSL